MGMPVGSGQLVSGGEDADSAAFVSVVALVMAVGLLDQRSGRRDRLDLLAQGPLLVLDPDDQGDVGFCRNLEMSF